MFYRRPDIFVVSIRPEGRQVQHRRVLRRLCGRTDVSIRPEGRQVQHPLNGLDLELPFSSRSVPKDGRFSTWQRPTLTPPPRSLNPSRRTAGSAPLSALFMALWIKVSIRPEGRQVQHPHIDKRNERRRNGLNPSRRTAGSAPAHRCRAAATRGGLNPSRRTAGSAPGRAWRRTSPPSSLNPSRRTAGSAPPSWRLRSRSSTGLNPSRRTAGSAPKFCVVSRDLGFVSIRPEGRQVQHQLLNVQFLASLNVSIRPEGRQVQHPHRD